MDPRYYENTVRLKEPPIMKDVIRELLPPDDYGKPLSPLTRWRIAIFMTCVSFLLFMMWAISPYGFALAGDVQKIRSNVDNVRLTQIEQQVYDAKESECASTDVGARRFFSNRVMQLVREYRQLAQAEVNIPPCRAVQVGAGVER
jgi:hypothetical protein